MSRYSGTNQAPYWRFRPTDFYGQSYPGGTYTADIMGCNWTCEHCWSKYGWKTVKPRFEHTPDQVVDKLVAGMKRNVQFMARISGGEAGMYWDDHTALVIGEFLERTQGVRIRAGGLTDRRGEPMGIIIETNGALVRPEQYDRLEAEFGEEAARVQIALGIKSTTPEGLAELTGLPAAVAERAHERQLESLLHLATNCEHLVVSAGFIDKFTDEGMYAALQREVERAKPGGGRRINLLEFKRFGNPNRFYTPKRLQKSHPDGLPDDDEETIIEQLNPDGTPKDDYDGEQLVDENAADKLREEAADIERQGFAEGRVK